MTETTRTPAELRNMFGSNLRILSRQYPSISELARQLRINRTQFNRYLSGESFPRPDVLDRICAFFDVDARILLEPVDSLVSGGEVLNGLFLSDFVGAGVNDIPEDIFPSGFYRFTRRSFVNDTQFILGLVHVHRDGHHTFVRGFEARSAMEQQGQPIDPHSREFRGFVTMQEDGVALVISRRRAMTASFNFLSRIASFENNYWAGYVTRTVRETVNGTRATRMVYEHLGGFSDVVMKTARSCGFKTEEEILPYHRRLLQTDTQFQ